MLSLKEKLDMWVSITGVNPSEDKKKYTISLDGKLSDFDIKRMNDRIMEALQFDKTGIFAEAYISIYLKKFVKERNVSLSDFLENDDLYHYINDVKKLYKSLKETNAEQMIVDEAKKVMSFYHLPCNLDALTIMELRSSAMKCMDDKLKLLQFSRGNKKSNTFKISRDIYMFKNLDALILCSARGNLNGVTLGYIKGKNDLTESFFCFIIKNGDNLYILTDMPQYSHPAQKGMKRCPGRDMSNRIESNWFPYNSIGNINTSDLWDTGRYGIKEDSGKTNEKELALTEDTPYAVIGTIDSLLEDEAFWFVMMADLIKKRFYEQELPALPISYTRSMIKSPQIDVTENALVVQKSLPSLELGEICMEDTNNLTYERENKEKSDGYQYLVDRYADKIDASILNVISNTERALYIEDKYAVRDYWGKKEGCEYLMVNLDNTAYTQEEIEYNQRWIARYNCAKAVNKAAKEDYEEKSSELYAKIKSYITPRIKELVKMHLRNELTGFVVERKNFGSYYTKETESFSKTWDFDKFYDSHDGFGMYRYGVNGYNKAGCRCAFTNKTPGVVIKINPKNAEELALVCGIKKEQLPVELQHYEKKEDRYYGNPILSNIDPFLWVIKDAFNTMEFEITIILSKTKYLEFCKEAGVEEVKFWKNEKPVCYKSRKDGVCAGAYTRRWCGNHTENHLSKKCEKCKWYKEQ